MSVTVKASLAARQFLRAYLLKTLPAKVASINAGRAAVLAAAYAGPYTVPASAVLKVGATIGAETSVSLTSGSRTAAQVAADITTAAPAGLTASADVQGRLVVTSSTAPAAGAPSVVSVAADGSVPTNGLFGWDVGGEQTIVSAIVAPQFKGVADGWPQDLGEMGPGFWVILEDSREVPRPNIRTNMYLVEVNAGIAWADPANNVSRNKEPIAQCLRAVREVIIEDRQLDTGTSQYPGFVIYLTETLSSDIKGQPLQWQGSPAFDAALLRLRIHVFENHL